ncbi:MAG TPA: VOC family protein [Kofleriaceae bacterium]|nr:VOC family protein [Kofleriaceae bacterium]
MAIRPTGLTPLLQVFDMLASLRFYRDVLGFSVVNSSPEIEAAEGRYFHWALLRLGDAELMLNTAYDANERPATRDRERWRGHGDTALYMGCNDLDAIHALLASNGVTAEPPAATQYGMRQLYVTDPDGYRLCFQHPIDA